MKLMLIYRNILMEGELMHSLEELGVHIRISRYGTAGMAATGKISRGAVESRTGYEWRAIFPVHPQPDLPDEPLYAKKEWTLLMFFPEEQGHTRNRNQGNHRG